MAIASSLAQPIAQLAERFFGEILQPGDPDYEAVRRVHNGLVDKRPALIARCRGVADIVDAVAFAREHDLEVSVRGGGHNVAGRAAIDDGLMIDLALMRGIEVAAKARTVRAQAGVTWGEFNRETQLHGLAATGGVVSTTGIAGLTLGGGLGWLMSKHGLAADHLRSARIVTADGQVLTASKEENSDLLWGLRGGGGNFGVAASLKYRLYPVGPTITGGLVAHPFEKARDVLRFYRDFTASLPDEMTVYAALLGAPDGSGAKLAAIAVCHCGPPDEGEAATRPIKKFGSPALDTIGPMPYTQMNSMLDSATPRGALNYWKSSYLAALSDEAILTLIDRFSTCPSPMSQLFLEHIHGAVTRVAVGDTAFPHREEGYNLLVLSQWTERSQNDRCIAWARDSYAALKPFLASDRYVNYLDDDEAGDPVAAAYGPNYPRLQKLKAKYDPGNFFHMNQNIRPPS
jgi:FAD/FMN-containing dehydrogenase